MPVNALHPEYDKMQKKWKRAIAVCKGQDAVHEGGSEYLPRLSEQTDDEYAAYKKRTPFYNASWRTVVGLQGMLFRKPPKVKVPEGMKDMLKDVTLTGVPLHIFVLQLVEECLKLGRVGVFVDYPVAPDNATRADVIAGNFRPSMKMYKALSIINWKTKLIKNKVVLSMVVLKEVEEVAIDEFATRMEEQFRVLDLVEVDGKHIFRVRLFRIDANQGELPVGNPVFPKLKGKNMESIPFQFIGVDDVSWKVDEPPLIDLFDMNLSHYRTTADYEHGCHFTGLPTAVISGYVPEANEDGTKEKFCIGSMTAWVFPRPDAKASYLEFTGQGLGALRENLERKEGYMAILGARMLEVDVKGGVESANTAALHRGGEQSTLSSVAQATSMGVTLAMEIFRDYADVTGEIAFELNRDFFPVPMDALTITAIIAGWQNGAYSYDTMFENLQKGEIIKPDQDVKGELALIEANPAPLPPGKVGATPGNVETPGPKANNTPATPAKTITQQQNGTGG